MSDQELKEEMAVADLSAEAAPATAEPAVPAAAESPSPESEAQAAASAEGEVASAAEAAGEEMGPPVRYELLEATPQAGSIVDLKFKVPPEEYDRKTQDYYKDLRQTVVVEGFRRGKAPLKLIQNRYHKEVEKDALDFLFTNCLSQIAGEKNYRILRELDRTNSGVAKDQDITFSVSLEIHPQIDPQGYDHFELTVDTHEVNEALVDAEIEKLRRRHATFQKTEMAPYGLDHGVVLDVRVTDDRGEEIPALTRQEQFFAHPDRSLPEEVERELRGMRAGDLFVVRVPNERKSEGGVITSAQDTYHLKVIEVRREVLPEFNDEFARDVGSEPTAAQLRERMRKELEQTEEQDVRGQAIEKIFNELIERNPFGVPQTLQDEVFKSLVEEHSRRLGVLGLRLEVMGEDPKEYTVRTQKSADRMVRVLALTQAIADKEKIEATDADLERAIARQAEREGRKPLAIRARLEKEKQMERFRDDLKFDLVHDFLLARAKISRQLVAPESKLVTV